jgi:cell division protein FtsX
MKQSNFTRKLSRVLLPVGLAFGAVASHAAIDTTAATAGVTDAQTAVLAVLAAMIGMAVAVWGTRRVLRFFGR